MDTCGALVDPTPAAMAEHLAFFHEVVASPMVVASYFTPAVNVEDDGTGDEP
jgi:hypothetical protein